VEPEAEALPEAVPAAVTDEWSIPEAPAEPEAGPVVDEFFVASEPDEAQPRLEEPTFVVPEPEPEVKAASAVPFLDLPPLEPSSPPIPAPTPAPTFAPTPLPAPKPKAPPAPKPTAGARRRRSRTGTDARTGRRSQGDACRRRAAGVTEASGRAPARRCGTARAAGASSRERRARGSSCAGRACRLAPRRAEAPPGYARWASERQGCWSRWHSASVP
jgi:hypothetical protein